MTDSMSIITKEIWVIIISVKYIDYLLLNISSVWRTIYNKLIKFFVVCYEAYKIYNFITLLDPISTVSPKNDTKIILVE